MEPPKGGALWFWDWCPALPSPGSRVRPPKRGIAHGSKDGAQVDLATYTVVSDVSSLAEVSNGSG
jgi:hypothetical protein